MTIRPAAIVGLLNNGGCSFKKTEKSTVINIYDKEEVIGYILQRSGKLQIFIEFTGESMPSLPYKTEIQKK